MPTAHHHERHFMASDAVRDVVIGMSDGLTVPFALAAGLSAALVQTGTVVTAGLAEIAAGAIAMGLGGYLAARHLLQTGRQQIAFLGPPQSVPEVAQRYEGFVRAHVEAALSPSDCIRVNCGFTPAQAYEATTDLLAHKPAIDGVAAASDVIAMSAIRGLSEAGRSVPGDVGVVGFDDVIMAAFTTPPLTTIRQDLRRGALLLVDGVITLASGGSAGSVEMPAELIVRGSTSAPEA